MISKARIENIYRVVIAAKDEFERIGQPGWCDRLTENFSHELSAWEVWYEESEDPRDMPTYTPTMADLNHELAKYGYKGIGGKNPRVVKL